MRRTSSISESYSTTRRFSGDDARSLAAFVTVKTFRAIGFPLGLAWSRLRHQPGRALLLALGVAAAAGALAVVIGGSLVAQDVSAGRALGAVPESKRAVAV